METLDLIALAKQCPEVTISVKASDLVEMGRTLKDELLQELSNNQPEASNTESETLITRIEAMKKLGVSSATLWRWKKNGYLVPIQLGRIDRYRLSDITALLTKKGGAL